MNEHSSLTLSVLSFNSRRIFYMSDLVGMSPGSFRVVLFVMFIIDLTTSNEYYGQGHLPVFDPGLLYQASHKNIELCKIKIFYLHKMSVFKKYV